MAATEHPRDEIALGAYYALFKVVSIADLEDDGRAIEWARSALDEDQLLSAFADTIRRREAGEAPRRVY